MNFDQFGKKNQGTDVRIRPMARYKNVGTGVLTPVDDLWKVQTVESRAVELLNVRTKQSVGLRGDNFREFRTPNFLMLRCQLTLTEEQVLIEPIVGGGGPILEPGTDTILPTPTPERPTIRENSAADILRNLKTGTRYDYQFSARVEELYRGRWTHAPGWRATVDSLPSRLSGDTWFCSFKETGSGTLIAVSTDQDVSALRPGDSVTISGRISDVSRLGSVSLDDAIVVWDESRETLDHEGE